MKLSGWVLDNIPDPLFTTAFNLFISRKKHIVIKKQDDLWNIIGQDEGDISLLSPTPKFFNVHYKVYLGMFNRFFKIEKGDVVLDVGACIGDTTVFMAKETGDNGYVIAVEPGHINCRCLSHNLAWFPHKEIHEIAASNIRANAVFYTHHTPTGHSLQYDPVRKGTVNVLTDTIDNIVGARHIDFAKIDVQGVEVWALAGADNLLKNTPKILVGTHYKYDPVKRTYPAVAEMLKGYGYKVNYCADNGIIYGEK